MSTEKDFETVFKNNKAFFDAIIMRSVKMVNEGKEFNKELIIAAAQEELEFQKEMCWGLTEKSKAFKQAMCESVYNQIKGIEK